MFTRIFTLNEAGVDVHVLSVSLRIPILLTRIRGVEAARLANDILADVLRRGGSRFAAFASLPPPRIDAAITEMKRCLDELGMLGITVSTTIFGHAVG